MKFKLSDFMELDTTALLIEMACLCPSKTLDVLH